jgi:hypothetical protein
VVKLIPYWLKNISKGVGDVITRFPKALVATLMGF